MNLEKNPCTKNKISKKKSSFPCEFSDEVCWSSGYLKSYVTKKQPSLKAQESSTSDCFGSDLVPKLGVRKFKNGRNNILAQSLDISIQKRLCFEFEYVRCSQLHPGSFSIKILRDFCYETLPTIFTNIKLILSGDFPLIWEYLQFVKVITHANFVILLKKKIK